jgi:hypothetical protein
VPPSSQTVPPAQLLALRHLADVRDRADGAAERLEAVLTAYSLTRHRHGGEAAARAGPPASSTAP